MKHNILFFIYQLKVNKGKLTSVREEKLMICERQPLFCSDEELMLKPAFNF